MVVGRWHLCHQAIRQNPLCVHCVLLCCSSAPEGPAQEILTGKLIAMGVAGPYIVLTLGSCISFCCRYIALWESGHGCWPGFVALRVFCTQDNSAPCCLDRPTRCYCRWLLGSQGLTCVKTATGMVAPCTHSAGKPPSPGCFQHSCHCQQYSRCQLSAVLCAVKGVCQWWVVMPSPSNRLVCGVGLTSTLTPSSKIWAMAVRCQSEMMQHLGTLLCCSTNNS